MSRGTLGLCWILNFVLCDFAIEVRALSKFCLVVSVSLALDNDNIETQKDACTIDDYICASI